MRVSARDSSHDWCSLLSPADSLAPEWLVVPDDVNDLPAAVWPASAARGADGELRIAGISATALAETYGTPLLVIDEDEVRSRARAFRSSFDAAASEYGTTAQVYYAGKALLTTTIARWVIDEGLRIDVCTGGELEVALAAGVAPASLGFHGNNKSVAELERAVEVGIGTIIVLSLIHI